MKNENQLINLNSKIFETVSIEELEERLVFSSWAYCDPTMFDGSCDEFNGE